MEALTTRIVREKGDRIRIAVEDSTHPNLRAIFTYSAARQMSQALIGFALEPREGADPGLLTVTQIRDLPVARWEQAARASVIQQAREALAGLAKVLEGQTATKLGGLAEVARSYRMNVAAGMRDPVASIARDHGVKQATAAGWVFRARKAGLLGPAIGRTPGEGPIQSNAMRKGKAR